ncbi:response regulator [Aurantiacibacter aquimixticola]|uniref:Response regulator n=1 Tax=Aurantiacibacter aquimixticola TaxID=1958945 RepID=A0A419RRC2_9SPHN|nr:response regulator [Aurantiacibacter aquimixticola]RJY08316.1 response regulator [Aurantiacibacter aquimixticola]
MSCDKTILLVEDEPLIMMDLEFAAQDRGCGVLCAIDVATALRHLDGDTPVDVAVLDVTLKNEETCLPVAEELDRRGIPYILHSGDLNRTDETVQRLGRQHIQKPSDSRKVIAAALSSLERQPADAD